MTTLRLNAYCGMSVVIDEGDRDACRKTAARTIRARRKAGYKVVTIDRFRDGHEHLRQWEFLEPEDCAMVPDNCGVLTLKTILWDCPWCGQTFEPKTSYQRFCDDSCAEAYNG